MLWKAFTDSGRKAKRSVMGALLSAAASLAGAVLLTLGAGAASAAPIGVIFDNGGPDGSSSFRSDFTLPQQQADDFELQSNFSTLTDIHWWGQYRDAAISPDFKDLFTIRIFDNNVNRPTIDPAFTLATALKTAMRMDTGMMLNGQPIFEYWWDLPNPLELVPDTRYWLSIVNDTPNLADNVSWGWTTTTTQTGARSLRPEDGDNWLLKNSSVELAYNLTGPVPEPGAATLFGVGTLIVGWATRRKARTVA